MYHSVKTWCIKTTISTHFVLHSMSLCQDAIELMTDNVLFCLRVNVC
uniref:Uncharacterized protein n=2 Tax=Anguilla anguilla TaxID=7936 RepID=A0A0E9RPX3_ANGAN